MNLKPNRTLPQKVYALLWGSSLRYEFINEPFGSAWFPNPPPDLRIPPKFWFLWAEPASRTLWAPEPVRAVLTHLQKRLNFGLFLTTGQRAFGFHVWFHWRLQLPDQPNTEQGFYARTPGYRWDLELGMIPTKGYFGSHWD